MTLRISPKNRFTAIIELDSVCRGTLPKKALPANYPELFTGEISAAEGEELLSLLRERAFNLLLDWLAQAERSTLQCRNFLKRKLYHSTIIEDAIARCQEFKYVDDTRFAGVLIRSYVARRASKRAIIAKLREQRVPSSIWEPLMTELYGKEETSENLGELMQKYCVTHRDLPRPKLKEKVFTYLFRKGFELTDILAAWENL